MVRWTGLQQKNRSPRVFRQASRDRGTGGASTRRTHIVALVRALHSATAASRASPPPGLPRRPPAPGDHPPRAQIRKGAGPDVEQGSRTRRRAGGGRSRDHRPGDDADPAHAQGPARPGGRGAWPGQHTPSRLPRRPTARPRTTNRPRAKTARRQGQEAVVEQSRPARPLPAARDQGTAGSSARTALTCRAGRPSGQAGHTPAPMRGSRPPPPPPWGAVGLTPPR